MAGGGEGGEVVYAGCTLGLEVERGGGAADLAVRGGGGTAAWVVPVERVRGGGENVWGGW